MVAGRVSVNGSVVTELGVRVNPDGDVVTVDGERVGVAARRWVVFHKPPGVLTTRTDPHGGTTIYDVLPEGMHGLRYVGRLDRDAEGLLLLTNDGELANALAHLHLRDTVHRDIKPQVAPPGSFQVESSRRILIHFL